jgi:hypothetical protein
MSRYLEVGTFLLVIGAVPSRDQDQTAAKGEARGSLLRPELKFKLSRNQKSVQIIFKVREKARSRAFVRCQKHFEESKNGHRKEKSRHAGERKLSGGNEKPPKYGGFAYSERLWVES